MYDNYLYPYIMFVVILQCKSIAFHEKSKDRESTPKVRASRLPFKGHTVNNGFKQIVYIT